MEANCSVPHEITFVVLLQRRVEILTHRAGPDFRTFHYLLIYTRLSALAAWYSPGTNRVSDSQTALGREDGEWRREGSVYVYVCMCGCY